MNQSIKIVMPMYDIQDDEIRETFLSEINDYKFMKSY